VAALNVYGQTIHSFFQFPPRIINPEEIKILRNRHLFESLKILILDEVSMVRADLMDAIDISLKKNTGREDLPFGGVQMVLVGDLLQLPPVIATEAEMQYLCSQYKTPYFLSAKCLQPTPPKVFELTRVFRQLDNNFIELLSQIRMGESLQRAISVINSCCFKGDEQETDEIVLTPGNAAAEMINQKKLATLNGQEHLFEGLIQGRFSLEENRLPSPKYLKLKTGCRVMFTKNDKDHRWVNGTIGTVTELNGKLITVQTESGAYCVNREVWESIQYTYDEHSKKIRSVTIGTYTQYPLMLAWAITIHKSQGKTFDKVVIDLQDGAFAEGQVYVALSRCRTLNGVRLTRPICLSDVRVDAAVKEYYRTLHDNIMSSP